jgi:tetratricopeptide (TPR) repeat protein
LDVNPKSAISLSILGSSYIAQQQFDQGFAALQGRLDKAPDWAEGYQIMGELAERAGRFPFAVTAFNKSLSLKPGLVSARLGLGDVYMVTNQLDQAQQQYEQVTAPSASRSYAQLRIGQIYERRRDFTKARQAYENAVSANPDNVMAKNNLAWDYAEHGGNVDVALKLAEEAKEKAPNDAGITDTLGWIYVKTGSYEAAVANLKESAAKDPKNGSYLYHLATAYYKLGRSDDARKELEAALKLPNFSDSADAKKLLAELPAR